MATELNGKAGELPGASLECGLGDRARPFGPRGGEGLRERGAKAVNKTINDLQVNLSSPASLSSVIGFLVVRRGPPSRLAQRRRASPLDSEGKAGEAPSGRNVTSLCKGSLGLFLFAGKRAFGAGGGFPSTGSGTRFKRENRRSSC